jgi:hypothetical protein
LALQEEKAVAIGEPGVVEIWRRYGRIAFPGGFGPLRAALQALQAGVIN